MGRGLAHTVLVVFLLLGLATTMLSIVHLKDNRILSFAGYSKATTSGIHLTSSHSSTKERKAMVIVEPREHPLLGSVLRNFHSIIPLEYDLYIIHSPNNIEFAREQASFIQNRTVLYMDIQDRLDETPTDTARSNYNALFKTAKFWEAIDAEIILVFQTDSILCHNSPYRIEDFTQYGYVGCSYASHFADDLPRYWTFDSVQTYFYGVGGLSLRRKSFQLGCIDKYMKDNSFNNWTEEYDDPIASLPEDVFFSYCLEQQQENSSYRPANVSVLQRFCCQWDLQEPTFGVHKLDEWLGDNVGFDNAPEDVPKLVHHCPEVLTLKPDIMNTIYNIPSALRNFKTNSQLHFP